MANATNQEHPPTVAVAVAGYGAALGSLFPIVAVMTTADVSGGLSVAADSAALVNTMQNIGAVAGLLIVPTFAFGIGRCRMMVATGVGLLLTSAACALAPSLAWMLIARVLHGVFGGVLPFLFMLLVMAFRAPADRNSR